MDTAQHKPGSFGRFEHTTIEVPLHEEVPEAEVRTVARERVVIRVRSGHDQVVVEGSVRHEHVEVGEDEHGELDPGQG